MSKTNSVNSARKNLHIKRAYEPATAADGRRILVDRLWPRGLKKQTAGLQAWMPEVAPSHELRKAFKQADMGWQEFADAYAQELEQDSAASTGVREIARVAAAGRVTLVFASRDTEHNNARVLREHILRLLQAEEPASD